MQFSITSRISVAVPGHVTSASALAQASSNFSSTLETHPGSSEESLTALA
jgi:hypothetical protein